MSVSNEFKDANPEQVQEALARLSTYFGGLIAFGYDPEEGFSASIPDDLRKPHLFESTCRNLVRSVLSVDPAVKAISGGMNF